MPRMHRAIRLLRFTLRSMSIAGFVIAAACCSSSEEVPAGHAFDVTTDEAGVIRTVSRGGPKYADSLFTYDAVVTLREDPAREESMLFHPTRIVMDAGGRYYVEDYGNGRIAVFDPEGNFHHAFGRKGQGPGEFEYPQIVSIENDVITLYDWMQSRTTRFSTGGELLSVDSHIFEAQSRVRQIYHTPEGKMILLGEPPIVFSAFTQYREYRTFIRATVLSAAGDTIATIDTPEVTLGKQFILEEYGLVAMSSIYFTGRPSLVYAPGRGLLMSTGQEPEVSWYDLGGNLTRVITIEQEREEVTADERAAIIQSSREQIENAEDDARRAMYRRIHELSEIPDTKDHWTDVLVDDAGFIWLECMPDYTVESSERTATYMVLSPEGEYLGSTAWPLSSGTLSHGHFLGFRTDEDTGETIGTVFRILPAVAGLTYPD